MYTFENKNNRLARYYKHGAILCYNSIKMWHRQVDCRIFNLPTKHDYDDGEKEEERGTALPECQRHEAKTFSKSWSLVGPS